MTENEPSVDAERLEQIEQLPLEQRAEAYEALISELEQELESSDTAAIADGE